MKLFFAAGTFTARSCAVSANGRRGRRGPFGRNRNEFVAIPLQQLDCSGPQNHDESAQYLLPVDGLFGDSKIPK